MDPLVVTFNGQPLDGSPKSVAADRSPGRLAEAIEAVEEDRVCRQTSGNLPSLTPESVDPGLESEDSGTAALGARDVAPQSAGVAPFDHLLQPGCAHQLSRHLAEIFQDDPPSDCGRTNGRTAGLSCAYGERYGSEVFSISAVMQLLVRARSFWDPHPPQNLIQISVAQDTRLIIVGDTHGQLQDVLWMFFKYGLPSPTNRYLFNGDIVDRGGHALEIFLLLFSFKRDLPDSVYVLRGNHEDALAIINFGFKAEIESKFPEHVSFLWNVFTTLIFPLLPIAALVSDAAQDRQFFVVHGGIPSKSLGLGRPLSIHGDLTRINRLRPTLKNLSSTDVGGRILYSLLWADPAEDGTDMSKGRSKLAGMFVEDETRAFCQINQVSFVVRSHQVPSTLRGVEASQNGLCYTVFSASNYSGCAGNLGGVLLCCGEPLELQACEHYAPPWPELAKLLPNDVSAGLSAPEEYRSRSVREWEEQFGIQDLGSNQGDSSLSLKFMWDWLRNRFGATPPISHGATVNAAARAQLKQFMTERIVEHKEELFQSFNCADPTSSGELPKAAWTMVMLSTLTPYCQGVLSPSVVADLFIEWHLSDPIQYVQFLHRFQIRDNAGSGSILVDRIQVVSQLQEPLVDFSAVKLDKLLDPDGDKIVSHQEFAAFLPHFQIEIPPWQAAALYETMASIVGQNPLTLDSTVMCLSLASQSTQQVEGEWSETVDAVGREIIASGQTFAGVFRTWDTSGDGFLSLNELEHGLRSLPTMQAITHEQARACMAKIEKTGVINDQVSIFEFVRAVAPHSMTLALHRCLLMETLKLVWICRPAFLHVFANMDPDATNTVSLEQFHACVLQINTQLQGMGYPQLTQIQVGAICEIAANGDVLVRYADFIRGLHVEDNFVDPD